MNSTTFEKWLSDQLTKGLVDIKFAILPGKSVSSEAVQDELIAAEAAIEAGFLKPAPQPTSEIPENIFGIIKKVTLH
ncbi:hypothetical protein CBR67_03650 [Bordetella hinzii]|jgi:hypothetical protein|uniref:hypothetical protein n=1 Tax=Alcaligenaceae TaxID=506 RepID=UPI001152A86D|nr:hypothetical protein [Bordetella hinzii]QDJ35816.1 hypothetical protein CBR67_03650 [Bordetella hinzii]